MTTRPVDRELLRAWRDTHDDVQPDRIGLTCERWVWIDGTTMGMCGEPSRWFGRGRMFCGRHMVERIKRWMAEGEQEVSA